MSTSSDRLIACVPKNGREDYRVQLRTRNGNRTVDVRLFAHNGVERVSTAKGFAIRAENLSPLIDALREAQAAAIEEGLIPRR